MKVQSIMTTSKLFMKFISCDYNVNVVHNFSLTCEIFLERKYFVTNVFFYLIAKILIILVSLAKFLFLVAISSQTIKGFHCLLTFYKKKLSFIIKSLLGCSLAMF